MNGAIIIQYDPFAMESSVYIATDNSQHQMRVCSDINGLADTVIGLAYGKDIYDVKIHAPYATINEIKRVINEHEQNIYSNQKITVEGI